MARFTVTAEGRAPTSYLLGQSGAVIGRAREADLLLDGGDVSRRHACLTWDGEAFLVEDLGSKNGTVVNGTLLSAPHRLTQGDVLELGGWTLRFEADEATATRPLRPGQAIRSAAKNGVVLKPDRREVDVRGRLVQLPPKEYLALTLLYAKAGTIVTKEELANHVWPEYGGDVSDYNIHQVVSRLRRELEEDPGHPRVVLTRPGFGYMLSP